MKSEYTLTMKLNDNELREMRIAIWIAIRNIKERLQDHKDFYGDDIYDTEWYEYQMKRISALQKIIDSIDEIPF